FSQSIDYDRRLYRYDILGSLAHARMLARQGIIAADDASAIERGLRQIAGEIEAGTFAFDHALEDIHTHVETRLREVIGPAAGVLHTARSRNDQIALDTRMFVRDALLQVAQGTVELMSALTDRAEEWQSVVVPGYTHLQRAQPVLLAHQALAYVEMLER